MNIIDSSLWIEYFIDSKNANLIEEVILDSEKLIIPTVILNEVFKQVLREKDEVEALNIYSMMKFSKIVELSENISINAAYISLYQTTFKSNKIIRQECPTYSYKQNRHSCLFVISLVLKYNLALADSIIYTTTIETNATLYTFNTLENVIYSEKK